jgi:hypothetical protein
MRCLLIVLLSGLLCGCVSTSSENDRAKAQTELQIAKYRVINTEAVWRADPKNLAKKKTYDDAVSDLDAKTAALSKGK